MVHPAPTRTVPRAPRVALAAALVALAGVPGLPAQAATPSPYASTSVIELSPGITWEQGVARTRRGVQSIQVGRIDTRHPDVRLEALLSNDTVVNLERPSRNANRNSRPGWVATLATNGDVSIRGDVGAGAVMPSMHAHDGELAVGTSCGRPTLGVDADGTARIGWVRNRITFDMTSVLPGWQGTILLRGVNREPSGNQLSLFTPRFGPSTLTTSSGIDVVLDPAGAVPVAGRVEATVTEVRRGVQDSAIPAGHWVLVGRGEKSDPLKLLKPGDRVSFLTEFGDGVRNQCSGKVVVGGWEDTREAMGGNYFTVRNGQNVAPTYAQYAKGGVPAPRTNVGITADGTVLMVVVDGRQRGHSVGMTLIEMGDLMLSLGAVQAFNLDGGGSSVMATRRPGMARVRVSNRPSDGRERSLTQALAVFAQTY